MIRAICLAALGAAAAISGASAQTGPLHVTIAEGQSPRDAVRQAGLAAMAAGLRAGWDARTGAAPTTFALPKITAGAVTTTTLDVQAPLPAPTISLGFTTDTPGLSSINYEFASATGNQSVSAAYTSPQPFTKGALVLQAHRAREVKRLDFKPPAIIALGTPFAVKINFPKNGVTGVSVRQIAERGGFDYLNEVPILMDGNENAIARITPLLLGTVKFIVTSQFIDSAYSVETFETKVNLPTAPVLKLFGDVDFVPDGRSVFHIRKGNGFQLRPVAYFDSVPGHEFMIQGWATYRLLPSDGAPVVALSEDGTISALRNGTAMAEVSFGNQTSQFLIKVMK